MKPINLLLTFLLIFIIFGCTNKDNADHGHADDDQYDDTDGQQGQFCSQ